MAKKVYEYKHCQECGAGFNARGYPKEVQTWVYCERCVGKHLDRPREFTITYSDYKGTVLSTEVVQVNS